MHHQFPKKIEAGSLTIWGEQFSLDDNMDLHLPAFIPNREILLPVAKSLFIAGSGKSWDCQWLRTLPADPFAAEKRAPLFFILQYSGPSSPG